MITNPLHEQQVIELLRTYYGINIQTAQSLAFGADLNALVYKADAKAQSYFVKIKYGFFDEIHLSILNILHDFGIQELIFPIYTIKGNLVQQLDDFKVIVYPFIQGQNGFQQDLTENQWLILGKTLNKIHQITLPYSIKQQLRKEIYPTQWREIVKSFYHKMEPDTSDDEITTNFKSLFKNHIETIDRLINSAEEFYHKLTFNPDRYVLCHSDIHAGNVLITPEKSLYIIDWDEPIMAQKERDLMFIGGGVGNVWNKPWESDCFYQGYGKTNIDNTTLYYYRCERIVEDIAEFGQELLSHRRNNKVKLEMFKHFKDMFEPNGVVDIALVY